MSRPVIATTDQKKRVREMANSQKPRGDLGTTPGSVPVVGTETSPHTYLMKTEQDALLDDRSATDLEELESDLQEEEEQQADPSLVDDEDLPSSGTDFDDQRDPFMSGSPRMDFMYRPVWLWTGSSLVWCDCGRSVDPYKKGLGESTRRLIEWTTQHIKTYLPWMTEASVASPEAAIGLFSPGWFFKNSAAMWSRMAILIPGGSRRILPISAFFGDYTGGGLPREAIWRWFRWSWLPGWCRDSSCSEREFVDRILSSSKAVSWKRGEAKGKIDGYALFGDFNYMLTGQLKVFVKRAIEHSGLQFDTGLDSEKQEKRILSGTYSPYDWCTGTDAAGAQERFRKNVFPEWIKRIKKELEDGKTREKIN